MSNRFAALDNHTLDSFEMDYPAKVEVGNALTNLSDNINAAEADSLFRFATLLRQSETSVSSFRSGGIESDDLYDAMIFHSGDQTIAARAFDQAMEDAGKSFWFDRDGGLHMGIFRKVLGLDWGRDMRAEFEQARNILGQDRIDAAKREILAVNARLIADEEPLYASALHTDITVSPAFTVDEKVHETRLLVAEGQKKLQLFDTPGDKTNFWSAMAHTLIAPSRCVANIFPANEDGSDPVADSGGPTSLNAQGAEFNEQVLQPALIKAIAWMMKKADMLAASSDHAKTVKELRTRSMFLLHFAATSDTHPGHDARALARLQKMARKYKGDIENLNTYQDTLKAGKLTHMFCRAR